MSDEAKESTGRIAAILDWLQQEDLLAFPETVKDEIGAALSVVQFGENTRVPNPGEGKGQASLKSWKTVAEIRTGRFTQSGSGTRFMSFTHSKRSRQAAFGPQRRTLINRRLNEARLDYEVRYGGNKD